MHEITSNAAKMEQPESQVEIAKKLLATLHSLIVHFPENARNDVDKLMKMIDWPKQSQLLISVVLGCGLLFQVFLKYVRVMYIYMLGLI